MPAFPSRFNDRPRFPAGLRVLVVDSDCKSRKHLSTRLSECEYSVRTCASGREALETLRHGHASFDVALVEGTRRAQGDPVDGYSICELVAPHMPVVMVCDQESSDLMLRGIKAGAVDFTENPPKDHQIKNIWQHAVRRASQGAGYDDAALAAVCTEALMKHVKNERLEESDFTPRVMDNGVGCDFNSSTMEFCLSARSSRSARPSEESIVIDANPSFVKHEDEEDVDALEYAAFFDAELGSDLMTDSGDGSIALDSSSYEDIAYIAEDVTSENDLKLPSSVAAPGTGVTLGKDIALVGQEQSAEDLFVNWFSCDDKTGKGGKADDFDWSHITDDLDLPWGADDSSSLGNCQVELSSMDIGLDDISGDCEQDVDASICSRKRPCKEDSQEEAACGLSDCGASTVSTTTTTTGGSDGDDRPCSKRRKLKVDWTPELHRRFVQVVEQLGADKAIPSRILELMNVKYLTRHNVASHLQKYRSHRGGKGMMFCASEASTGNDFSQTAAPAPAQKVNVAPVSTYPISNSGSSTRINTMTSSNAKVVAKLGALSAPAASASTQAAKPHQQLVSGKGPALATSIKAAASRPATGPLASNPGSAATTNNSVTSKVSSQAPSQAPRLAPIAPAVPPHCVPRPACHVWGIPVPASGHFPQPPQAVTGNGDTGNTTPSAASYGSTAPAAGVPAPVAKWQGGGPALAPRPQQPAGQQPASGVTAGHPVVYSPMFVGGHPGVVGKVPLMPAPSSASSQKHGVKCGGKNVMVTGTSGDLRDLPSREDVSAIIREALNNPKRAPPLGLRPPSMEAVVAELQSNGFSASFMIPGKSVSAKPAVAARN